MEDMFPSLLQKIKAEFEKARLDSEILEELLEKLEENKANYHRYKQIAVLNFARIHENGELEAYK